MGPILGFIFVRKAAVWMWQDGPPLLDVSTTQMASPSLGFRV